MATSIMRVEMIDHISEYANDDTVRKELKPRNLEKRTPSSLLSSLSNIEIAYGNGWKQMTELTKDNRLIYRMFNVGHTSDMGGE